MPSEEISFREFEPQWVRFDDTCLFLGPPRSGKTVGARLILLASGKPPRGMVQVGSPEGLKTWTENLPIVYLHQSRTIDESVYKKWMDVQEARIIEVSEEVKRKREKWRVKMNAKIDAAQKKEQEALLERAEKENWPQDRLRRKTQSLKEKYEKVVAEETKLLEKKRSALYDQLAIHESCFSGFDDLGDEKKAVMDHPIIKKLMATHRHYAALTFVICQYAKHLNAQCRLSCDWLFIWAGSLSPKDMEKVIDDYIPACYFSKRDAIRAFQTITDRDPQNCMVVWRANPNSKKAGDCVFFWNPVASISKQRGKLGFFGDPDYKLYSDLFYNGTATCSKIPQQQAKKKKPTRSLKEEEKQIVSGPTKEERIKLVQAAFEEPQKTSDKQNLLAHKRSQARWKRAESHRQKN